MMFQAHSLFFKKVTTSFVLLSLVGPSFAMAYDAEGFQANQAVMSEEYGQMIHHLQNRLGKLSESKLNRLTMKLERLVVRIDAKVQKQTLSDIEANKIKLHSLLQGVTPAESNIPRDELGGEAITEFEGIEDQSAPAATVVSKNTQSAQEATARQIEAIDHSKLSKMSERIHKSFSKLQEMKKTASVGDVLLFIAKLISTIVGYALMAGMIYLAFWVWIPALAAATFFSGLGILVGGLFVGLVIFVAALCIEEHFSLFSDEYSGVSFCS